MFRRFLFSRIWSSAQDHAVLVLLQNLVSFFISIWPRRSGGNDLYHSCTSVQGASRGGQPLNIFTWFTGAGGLFYLCLYIGCVGCVCVCVYVCRALKMIIGYVWKWWEYMNANKEILNTQIEVCIYEITCADTNILICTRTQIYTIIFVYVYTNIYA